jgi:phage terminase large subunit
MQSSEFKKTPIQYKAIQLLASKAKHIMLFGGSRSGKTFIIVFAIIVRACKTKSRHVILRQHFNHVKTSIWMDTLLKVLSLCFPDLVVEKNKTDYCLYIPSTNGISEVWIAGLDNGDRVEKILGKEYSTIFFNECSQIPYDSVSKVLTRLAEKNSLAKKVYYDENPPTKKHWSYPLFIKKVNPIDSTPIKKEDYACMLMNPMDNLENIDGSYLEILESLPEKDRLRFMLGEFVDGDDGEVYYEFNSDLHVGKCNYNRNATLFICLDFNVNPMSCSLMHIVNDGVEVFDEIFLNNSDTYKMMKELKKRGYSHGRVIPDSTGKNRKTSGKSDFVIIKEAGFVIESVRNPYVTDRVNAVNRLLKAGNVKIDPKCKHLINDLEKVSWKDNKLDQKTDPMLTHMSDNFGYGIYFHFPHERKSNARIIVR